MVKKRITIMVVLVGILLATIVGTSYAAFNVTSTQDTTNVISVLNCLEIEITNGKNPFDLQNAFPIKDEVALEKTPYTFTATNKCARYVEIDLGFEVLTGSTLEASKLKTTLSENGKKGAYQALSLYPLGTAVNGGTAYVLLTDGLKANESKSYDFRMWLPYELTEEDVEGKSLNGKIIISATVKTPAPENWATAPEGTLLAGIRENNYEPNEDDATGMTIPGQVAATTNEGLRKTRDDYGISYYYRGAVENNYVSFAGMCWRIVRIDGQGNTKLTLYNYNPTGAENPCAASLDGEKMAFARVSDNYKSKFNSSYNHNAYIGYMYGDVNGSTYEEVHANTNKSTILTFLMTWYDEKLRSYNDLLADTIWCNDKRVVTDTTYDPWNSGNITGTGLGKDKTNYQTAKRLYPSSSAVPSLKCGETSEDNKISKYTASDKANGNGALTFDGKEYKIGLLTADEIAFAGATAGTGNSSYYLYKNANDGSNWYWSLSPCAFSGYNASVWFVYGAGKLVNDYVISGYGVRPAVSLKSTASITSGNGTQSNPFVVYAAPTE